jgi:hypothetical protein
MVYSIDEAMEWFLSHSSGTVLCVRKDGQQKECSSFPEARAFFEEKEKA